MVTSEERIVMSTMEGPMNCVPTGLGNCVEPKSPVERLVEQEERLRDKLADTARLRELLEKNPDINEIFRLMAKWGMRDF